MKTKTLALILCVVMALAFCAGAGVVVFADGNPAKLMATPMLIFLLALMIYKKA